MSYTSYKLYQKYLQYGNDAPVPAYPMEYSYNGEGTMTPVVNMQNDPACGEPQPLPPIIVDYSDMYLTIESQEDNNVIYFKDGYSGLGLTISASTDNGATWTAYTASSGGSGTTIATLNAGDKLLIKGENATYATSTSRYNQFKTTKQFEVKGNIMSLVSGDSFDSTNTLTDNYTFCGLFSGCTELTSAENLILPATTLAGSCYRNMFARCTSLTTAPVLSATTLAEGCYNSMFSDCESLTTAPALPATTLANYCYYSMFASCFNLTTAPVLSATTLAIYCYSQMFKDCTSLTTAPALPAMTLDEGCYEYMFEDCSSLTTAPALPATTLATSCYRRMFGSCSSLTTAPVLSATTLVESCYRGMFNACSSLNYVKCLATDVSASYCTTAWLYSTASSGTFVKASSMTGWSSGTSGIPNNWTVQNA